jgi:hypothetical protein
VEHDGSSSAGKIGALYVSPAKLSRFLSKEDRDRSVVLLDVETFCPGDHPTFLFNVILNSIKVRSGTLKRADYHFATMGVEVSVFPEGAKIVDYTQSAQLTVQYQTEIAKTATELSKAGAITLVAGDNKGDLNVSFESGIEHLVKGSAAFVSTENELVATYRTADLQWRLDPISAAKVIRQFQQGNLWLTRKLEATLPAWKVEVSVRPTELRAYSANMVNPLSDMKTLWMLTKMWAGGVAVRDRNGEVFTLSARKAP